MKQLSAVKRFLLYVEEVISREQFKGAREFLFAASMAGRAVYGVMLVALSLIIITDPPYTNYSLIFVLLFFMSFIVLIPKATKFITKNATTNGKIVNGMLRIALATVFFLAASVFINGFLTEARLKLMTPEQIAQNKLENDRLIAKSKLENDRRASNEYDAHKQAIASEAEKIQQEKLEDDAEVENERQSKFYDTLSAPKILYKCSDSPFTHASGAKYGSYNTILESAYNYCRQGSLDIIDYEK